MPEGGRGGAGGATPENSWWGLPPGFPNPNPTSDLKMCHFSHPFSDSSLRNYVIIT